MGEQRSPPQTSLASYTIDLAPYSRFLYIDTAGRSTAIVERGLERAQAERSGATITVSGNTMVIARQGFTLTIIAETMTEVDGIIRADNIRSILLAADPAETYVDGAGLVTSSFNAGFSSLPNDASITTIIGEPVTPLAEETFRIGVARTGDTLEAIAYTMTIQKTNIARTLPATITMSVPAEWVNAHGGISAIAIGRIADDQTCTILETSYQGYNGNGNMEFTAISPEGLSVFGLLATTGPHRGRTGMSGFRGPVQTSAVPESPGLVNGIIHTITEPVIVILIIILVLITAGCILWKKQKTPAKRSDPLNKK